MLSIRSPGIVLVDSANSPEVLFSGVISTLLNGIFLPRAYHFGEGFVTGIGRTLLIVPEGNRLESRDISYLARSMMFEDVRIFHPSRRGARG